MSKSLRNLLLAAPAIFGIALSTPVVAQEADANSNLLNQLNSYSSEGRTNTKNQVTNVNQLRDVSPADWAYEALRSLVDRYSDTRSLTKLIVRTKLYLVGNSSQSN